MPVVAIAALFLDLPIAAAEPRASAPIPSQNAGPRVPDVNTRPKAPIAVWAVHNFEFSIAQDTVRRFNRGRPPHPVELLPSIHRDYEERLKNAAAAGTLPCVMEIDGPFLAEFAWPGYLRPLDDLVPKELLRDLLPSILAQGTYAGHLYSVAQYEFGLGLWGNRRYLRAAGVRIATVEQPWTLQEFEGAMQKLAAVPGVEYPLNVDLYTAAQDNFARFFLPLLQGFGGDLLDRATYRSATGVLDGPASVAAMKHLQYWLKQGWTRDGTSQDFDSGRTALSWAANWVYAEYLKALGEDLVLMPLPDLGNGIKIGTGSWSWAISSTCPYPNEAWRFIAQLMSPEVVLLVSNANGGIPARRSVIVRAPLYAAHGPMRVFIQQLDAGFGVPRPTTPAYGTISSAFFAAVRGIVAGGEPQAELSKAATRIDREIALHRGYPNP
jgi:multiple sugar transport system substrate-binding protein